MDRIDEIQRSLGRIEGAVESMLTEQKRLAEYAANNSKRIGEVERQHTEHVSRVRGWAAGAGAVAAVLVSVIKWLVMGHR